MAISPLSPRDDQFLTTSNRIQGRITRAQLEITSGKRVLTASDSPDEVDNLLGLRAELARSQQIQSNLNRTKTEVGSAERALEDAVKVLERVRVIGSRGASGTSDFSTRQTIAGEVTDLLNQLVTLANTKVEGRYIFAGDDDLTVPFQIDPAPPQTISAYGGSTTLRTALHPSGTTFTFSQTADQIFDNPDPAKNAFANIRTLRDALLANDEAAIQAALPGVESASQQIIQAQAGYGNSQARITSAIDSVRASIVRFQTQIAGIEDADVTKSILDLNSSIQNQEAALAAKSRSPRGSLFDYLG